MTIKYPEEPKSMLIQMFFELVRAVRKSQFHGSPVLASLAVTYRTMESLREKIY